MKRVFGNTFFILFLFHSLVSAEEIHLKNGDRLTGKILQETEKEMTLKTQFAGTIIIDKQHIKQEEKSLVQQNKDIGVQWERKFSVGYSQAGGNTEKSHGAVSLNMNRKTDGDEWTLRADAYYGSTDKKMDAKKFAGMLRYAYSYGKEGRWYHFYKMEGNQDRFANVNYRIIPSSGIGYWLSDREDFKLMGELAAGFEHTNYRDTTKSSNEAILIPRAYFEKRLMRDLTFREDITLYPSLKDTGEYRLHSESALINAINKHISLKISFIDDFDSSPSGSAKKNDYRLISSIDYTF